MPTTICIVLKKEKQKTFNVLILILGLPNKKRKREKSSNNNINQLVDLLTITFEKEISQLANKICKS
jgi:hypothetical protein